MSKSSSNAFALITRKLGFAPRGGCDECPNLDHCAENERELPTLPCELDDEICGIDPLKPSRSNAGPQLTRAA